MGLIFYTNPMSRGQIARWAYHNLETADQSYGNVWVGQGLALKALDPQWRAILRCA